MRFYTIDYILIFSSFLLGGKMPDWDMKLKLKHRSILTHSPIISLFLIFIYNVKEGYIFRNFLIGYSMGVAVHLLFDIFPNNWRGGALIKIPFFKLNFNKKNSKIFLAFSTIINVYISIFYIINIKEFVFIFVLSLFYFCYNRKKEKIFFRPVLFFTFLNVLFLYLKFGTLFLYNVLKFFF